MRGSLNEPNSWKLPSPEIRFPRISTSARKREVKSEACGDPICFCLALEQPCDLGHGNLPLREDDVRRLALPIAGVRLQRILRD